NEGEDVANNAVGNVVLEGSVHVNGVDEVVREGSIIGEMAIMRRMIQPKARQKEAVKALTSLLEPIMMVGIGGMVGSIIIGMYLPMFSVISAIK
ncbi:MAG: hypothetical protein AABZ74_10895, partial [Cyanobacteriota bacterium]